MLRFNLLAILGVVIYNRTEAAYFDRNNFNCGPYGFICERADRLRLCGNDSLHGPSFKCPINTICNEDSSNVCENSINYIEPDTRKHLHCHRNERIPDPNVPECKGYILCIPNKNNFQGIKFKCGGNTVFNAQTRTCSAANLYTCPTANRTNHLNGNQNHRVPVPTKLDAPKENRPIECKNYKFSVTNDHSPVRAAYFCPSRSVNGEISIRCTIFSSKYCLTLEKEDEGQYSHGTGLAYRKPRV